MYGICEYACCYSPLMSCNKSGIFLCQNKVSFEVLLFPLEFVVVITINSAVGSQGYCSLTIHPVVLGDII